MNGSIYMKTKTKKKTKNQNLNQQQTKGPKMCDHEALDFPWLETEGLLEEETARHQQACR